MSRMTLLFLLTSVVLTHSCIFSQDLLSLFKAEDLPLEVVLVDPRTVLHSVVIRWRMFTGCLLLA